MQQTRAELLAHLDEQLGFLDASCEGFDAGRTAESKRLAHAVRVLLWNTGSSHALLGQLTDLQSLTLLDNLYIPPREDGATMLGRIGLTIAMGEQGMEFRASVPLSEDLPRVALGEWWDGMIMYNAAEGVELTRRRVVRELSNKDGGSHVDPVLPTSYRELSRLNGFQLHVVNTDEHGNATVPPPEQLNPYPPAMRQIAEEVRVSIRQSPELFRL